MEIFIVGAGAHGRVVLDILRDRADGQSVQFADDNESLWGRSVNGAPVVSLREALSRKAGEVGFVVSVGKPRLRLELCRRVLDEGHTLVNAIHPKAVVEASATMGLGNMISPQAVVNSNARLGNAVVVNTSVVVEHDCVVEDGVSISPVACLGGRVTVGQGAFIAIGARIMARVHIGAGSIVGAHSLVLKDVPDDTLVFGSPARIQGVVDDGFDWGRVL
jgi:sugar O-acyltransferase (sialic acid O-acetyltransferase NeuD family)